MLYVRVAEADGRSIDRIRTELHPDRRIWDLTYNGIQRSIQRSIANGCERPPTRGSRHPSPELTVMAVKIDAKTFRLPGVDGDG